jgi:hypothetical protein
MKWGRFAILALALVVSACGERGGGSLESTSNEEKSAEAASGPALETNGTGTFTYEVWFAGSGGFLSVSKRQTNLEPEAPKVPKVALDSLLAGPSEAEAAAGVFTAVPAEAVDFRLEGEPVKLFGGHGILLDRPQARRDFRDFLPAQS